MDKLIDWGVSIRGCWFLYDAPENSNYEFIRCEKIIQRKSDNSWETIQEEGAVKWTEEAVNYLIDNFFKYDNINTIKEIQE